MNIYVYIYIYIYYTQSTPANVHVQSDCFYNSSSRDVMT